MIDKILEYLRKEITSIKILEGKQLKKDPEDFNYRNYLQGRRNALETAYHEFRHYD